METSLGFGAYKSVPQAANNNPKDWADYASHVSQ